MTNELTLENIRSGAFPSDAHAVGFLLGEIERLTRISLAARALLKYIDDHDWGLIPEGQTADTLRDLLKGEPTTHEPLHVASFPSQLAELYNAIAGYEKLSGYAPALLAAMRQLSWGTGEQS